MFTLFMILAPMFLISGGIGFFYTNINFSSSSHYWIFRNLVFGTFTLTGILTLIFMALFNTGFD